MAGRCFKLVYLTLEIKEREEKARKTDELQKVKMEKTKLPLM